ncbi:MAG: sigma-54 dependent transcriptional regulator [Tannerellaceae bacterium]|jgi:two-component system NtrC family response regulator|nr:sigma-54 dependent transcriptional regulator [Tannerellaceae bacterium]
MILICDDDMTVRASLTLVLKRAGYQVETASTPKEAIAFVRQTSPELILMDMNYTHTTTGEEGLQLLAEIRVFCPDVPVILITAWGSIGLAVKGIKAGAFDFITKPWNNLLLLNTIQTAIQLSRQDGKQKETPPPPLALQDTIIGRSPLLAQVLQTVNRIAHTNASVLITGESGTGKELIAEAIHQASHRREKPFIKVNLGGISQSLFESEMFGHKQGAFTDARRDRAGRFELADKGTIFLDEIGELDVVCQVKLLRVLQDRTFEVLGDSRPRQVDTRVISATNRHLAEMVTRGAFREDLFYRINLITIRVPSLRERLEDLPLLVAHFVRKQAEANQTEPAEIAADAYDFLRMLPWPGNIRELKNLVDRTILVSGKRLITGKDLKEQYIEIPVSAGAEPQPVQSLESVERHTILKAVERYGGNLSKVAAALGVTRQALYRRLEKYGITLPE